MGPIQIFLFGLIFTLCFHHSKLKNFELEWWKHKTRNQCFQKLKYITQGHQCKFSTSVEPTTSVLSCQLRAAWYYHCKFKAKTISLSHFPQKILAKISPPFSLPSLRFLSHFITPSNLDLQRSKLKHEVGLKSFLYTWVWTEVGLKSFLCPLQKPFEGSFVIFS